MRHDVTDELAAYKLAAIAISWRLRIFFSNRSSDEKCPREKMDREFARKIGNASDLDLLQKTFDRMK